MATLPDNRDGQQMSWVWLPAGLLYFALALLLGFLLGTIRTLLLIPLVGEVAAVLLELPVILAATWWGCAQIVGRLDVNAAWSTRILMGGFALVLLLSAEFLLFVYLFDNEASSFLTRPGDWLGLAGQIVYALFPILQIKYRKEL